MSKDAKDLIDRLLNRNPEKRLGAKGVDQIFKHPFFKDVNWDDVTNKKYEPPYKPKLKNIIDLSHISSSYTEFNLDHDTVDQVMSFDQKKQRHMSEFSYSCDDVPKNFLTPN